MTKREKALEAVAENLSVWASCMGHLPTLRSDMRKAAAILRKSVKRAKASAK